MDNFKTKIDAVLWARGLMAMDNFLILDFETTDKPDYKRGTFPDICQIGLINKHGDVLFSTHVKPLDPIQPGAAAVHGITADMVANAPTFRQLYPDLFAYLNDKTVIAYNVSFEQPVLEAACGRNFVTPIRPLFTCAMLAYACYHGERSKFGSFKWKKLSEAAEAFNIDTEGAHDALTDVKMTLKLIEAMAA